MGLRSLIPTATVEVPGGGEFTVRGFSPNDALILYRRHAGELSNLFDQFTAEVAKSKKKKVEPEDVARIGIGMAGGVPQVMAEVIVLATGVRPDNPEFDDDVAAALDFGAAVQVDALKKVYDLTFTPDMPPGKFIAVVLQIAQASTAAMTAQAA